jgi:pilus assembly protein CpaF
MSVHDALKRAVRDRALADPDGLPLGDRRALRAHVEQLVARTEPLLAGESAERVYDELVRDLAGLGPVEDLLADPEVTEIMLNGPGTAFVERRGRIEPVALALDAATLVRTAERIIAPLGLRLDRSSPIVDARLADGSRLHAVLPPLAPDGPCLTIRRFARRPTDLAEFGVGPDASALVAQLVAEGRNVMVSGATSAGKTSLLGALGALVDPRARVVTIEETLELALPLPHVVRLEARPANSEGAGAVSVRDLVRTALRMRPDRIVIGEVRGGEAFDLLQALNTGHDGSLGTVHANDPAAALQRIEMLALLAGLDVPFAAVRAQVHTAIDVVMQVQRGTHGRRVVSEIAEVVDIADTGLDAIEAGATRRLAIRRHGELVVVSDPRRAPRRSDQGAAT